MTKQLLTDMYGRHFGRPCTQIAELPQSGSNRRYYRLTDGRQTAIGVWSRCRAENEAFVAFSRQLAEAGIRVPQIYATDLDRDVYLQQDLGDTTLYALASRLRAEGHGWPDELTDIYRRVLDDLVAIQLDGGRHIDYSLCYPRSDFDRRSMMWDLHYFKYYFLKLAHIPFDEQRLEDDFETLADYLLQADATGFLYRDFQSRNIMIVDGQPWFIDYQGGRRGAPHYDVASLLFDAKADIPDHIRTQLLHHYTTRLQQRTAIDPADFENRFYAFVLIRIMQAMGAYGYRGFYERKDHFLKSIPFALRNMELVIDHHPLPMHLPQLQAVWRALTQSDELRRIAEPAPLTVSVVSFSYKRGWPQDPTGNGGGHMFDCRALPNPGREARYADLTGKDRPVIDFFARHADEMERFIDLACRMTSISIERYAERGFANLLIGFGCTGGRHRSVYCAEAAARRLAERFAGIRIVVKHLEQGDRL